MDSELPIPLPKAHIEDYCRRKHFRKLSLFGSVLTDKFEPDSDIDVLAEFEPGVQLGWDFFSLGDELERLWGHKVDFNTIEWISPYFRKQVLKSAREIYAGS